MPSRIGVTRGAHARIGGKWVWAYRWDFRGGCCGKRGGEGKKLCKPVSGSGMRTRFSQQLGLKSAYLWRWCRCSHKGIVYQSSAFGTMLWTFNVPDTLRSGWYSSPMLFLPLKRRRSIVGYCLTPSVSRYALDVINAAAFSPGRVGTSSRGSVRTLIPDLTSAFCSARRPSCPHVCVSCLRDATVGVRLH